MNDQQSAQDAIVAFLRGPEQFLLLNGTHQHKKHVLALWCVTHTYEGGVILFRANSARNLGMFLGMPGGAKPKLPQQVRGMYLYSDTINPKSWKNSPAQIGVGIIYPLDSLDPDDGSYCVQDLQRRGPKKILLVTWTDNKSFAWTDHLNPVRVTYDAEAEQPDYHARMKDIEAETARVKVPASLPSYAANCAPDRLVKIECFQCRTSRWAELNQTNPGRGGLHAAKDGEYQAKCLKCGYVATDHYNW